jgi:rod shape-determining protein MreC
LLRLFRNKALLLVLFTIIMLILIGFSSSQNSKINRINNLVSVPLTPIQRFFSYVGQRIDSGLSFLRDMKLIRLENEELKIRINELEKENRELLDYKEKNEQLRKALNLKDRFDDYEIIGGNVIAKDPGNWFNIFKIDVGERDGVMNDLPVLSTGKSLVGRIMATDITSSKVITIIDEDSVLSGWISKAGGGPVRIRGDLALKEQGLCRMDYIPVDVNVEVGDVIETSGLGGIYPKGIVIGKVKEVRTASSELDRYAVIEPSTDFKRIEEVFVLKKKAVDFGVDGVQK